MSSISFVEPTGQGLLQFAELGLALVLSGLIGLEREIRQKSAGLRTYTLVGLASALIILISKWDSPISWPMAAWSSILRA
jgi:putative Mg2+ transporter-C (MgtC) family protein